MDDLLIKAAYVAALVAVTLGGIIVKRLYNSIDLLFKKIDSMTKEVHTLQMAVCSIAPEKTKLLTAFMVRKADD